MGEFSDFYEIQTKTAWGKTLAEFAVWCAPQPGSCILDVGSGPGLLPHYFMQAGSDAIGIDNDLALLASAPGEIPLAAASIYEIPFSSATFDLLTATNVIFLLDDPLNALAECRRVLRDDGRLCLLNPSERLSVASATALADARGLDGKGRESLLHWAGRADKLGQWDEDFARKTLAEAGFRVTETKLIVGPGFARLTCAVKG